MDRPYNTRTGYISALDTCVSSWRQKGFEAGFCLSCVTKSGMPHKRPTISKYQIAKNTECASEALLSNNIVKTFRQENQIDFSEYLFLGAYLRCSTQDGLIVVDLDNHGVDTESFATYKHNLDNITQFLGAPTVISPNGGSHWYIFINNEDRDKYPVNAMAFKNLDIKANGGIVITPPSAFVIYSNDSKQVKTYKFNGGGGEELLYSSVMNDEIYNFLVAEVPNTFENRGGTSSSGSLAHPDVVSGFIEDNYIGKGTRHLIVYTVLTQMWALGATEEELDIGLDDMLSAMLHTEGVIDVDGFRRQKDYVIANNKFRIDRHPSIVRIESKGVTLKGNNFLQYVPQNGTLWVEVDQYLTEKYLEFKPQPQQSHPIKETKKEVSLFEEQVTKAPTAKEEAEGRKKIEQGWVENFMSRYRFGVNQNKEVYAVSSPGDFYTVFEPRTSGTFKYCSLQNEMVACFIEELGYKPYADSWNLFASEIREMVATTHARQNHKFVTSPVAFYNKKTNNIIVKHNKKEYTLISSSGVTLIHKVPSSFDNVLLTGVGLDIPKEPVKFKSIKDLIEYSAEYWNVSIYDAVKIYSWICVSLMTPVNHKLLAIVGAKNTAKSYLAAQILHLFNLNDEFSEPPTVGSRDAQDVHAYLATQDIMWCWDNYETTNYRSSVEPMLIQVSNRGSVKSRTFYTTSDKQTINYTASGMLTCRALEFKTDLGQDRITVIRPRGFGDGKRKTIYSVIADFFGEYKQEILHHIFKTISLMLFAIQNKVLIDDDRFVYDSTFDNILYDLCGVDIDTAEFEEVKMLNKELEDNMNTNAVYEILLQYFIGPSIKLKEKVFQMHKEEFVRKFNLIVSEAPELKNRKDIPRTRGYLMRELSDALSLFEADGCAVSSSCRFMNSDGMFVRGFRIDYKNCYKIIRAFRDLTPEEKHTVEELKQEKKAKQVLCSRVIGVTNDDIN